MAGGEASEPQRRAQPQACQGQSREIPAQRLGAEQYSPAREACLLSRRGGRGLGAEARASVLAGRESRKSLQLPKRQETFSCLFYFAVRKERGFRAQPKRAPETGASRGDQRGPQRRAGDAKAAAAATKKPVCEHRSLSTTSLLGAGAARHCQGPVILGQLPRENARRASGCCNVMWPLPPQTRPAFSVPLPLPT